MLRQEKHRFTPVLLSWFRDLGNLDLVSKKKRSKQDVMLTGRLEALGASPCTWCMTLAWEAGTGRAVTSHSSLAWLTY